MKKILLMEDDQEQAWLIRECLRAEGREITIARNADIAMQVIAEVAFDLVISDIFVRDNGVFSTNGGLRLIGHLRNRLAPPQGGTARDVPVIAISGFNLVAGAGQGHFLQIAEGIGADLCLSKPVAPDLLRAHVAGMMGEEPAQGTPGQAPKGQAIPWLAGS